MRHPVRARRPDRLRRRRLAGPPRCDPRGHPHLPGAADPVRAQVGPAPCRDAGRPVRSTGGGAAPATPPPVPHVREEPPRRGATASRRALSRARPSTSFVVVRRFRRGRARSSSTGRSIGPHSRSAGPRARPSTSTPWSRTSARRRSDASSPGRRRGVHAGAGGDVEADPGPADDRGAPSSARSRSLPRLSAAVDLEGSGGP